MPNRQCSRGHREKSEGGVCPTCRRIAQEDREPKDVTPEEFVVVVESKGSDYWPAKEFD